MTWMDTIGFTVSVITALECVIGRMAQLDRRRHRHIVIAGYTAAACVCILAASLTWQGLGVFVLDVLSLCIAAHLLLTREDWRHHAPASALRDDTDGMMPAHADSRQDDRR